MNESIARGRSTAPVLLFAAALALTPTVSAAGKIVTANRVSGTLSVIDVRTDQVISTVTMPDSGEPMYVVYSPPMHRVFVGDRANNRVAVFDAGDLSYQGAVPAGAGVFHMWSSSAAGQLWVNNDIDNTATVIDTISLEVIATVAMPADLVSDGGKPHDVVLDQTALFAFVTMLGGTNDYVIRFDAKTFGEVGRAVVGQDPHVSLSRQGNLLYVPCQNSNEVIVLNRDTLQAEPAIPVMGAHGAGMTRSGRLFYTTDLPGLGVNGLVAIDTSANAVVGFVNTPYPVPHNIALTPSGRKIYVTHSGGTADKVSIYAVEGAGSLPVPAGDVTVGLNPFGVSFVP